MDGGLSIALLATAVIAAGVSAYGAYTAAQDQKDTLKANQKAREQDAAITEQAGQEAAARQRKRDSYALNSFGAKAAAAGVVAHEGSSLMSEMDFASQSELEAQHVKYGYDLQAREKRVGASFMGWQASKVHPEMEAGKSLLASAGSIAGSYTSGAYNPSPAPGAGATGGGIGYGAASTPPSGYNTPY